MLGVNAGNAHGCGPLSNACQKAGCSVGWRVSVSDGDPWGRLAAGKMWIPCAGVGVDPELLKKVWKRWHAAIAKSPRRLEAQISGFDSFEQRHAG